MGQVKINHSSIDFCFCMSDTPNNRSLVERHQLPYEIGGSPCKPKLLVTSEQPELKDLGGYAKYLHAQSELITKMSIIAEQFDGVIEFIPLVE